MLLHNRGTLWRPIRSRLWEAADLAWWELTLPSILQISQRIKTRLFTNESGYFKKRTSRRPCDFDPAPAIFSCCQTICHHGEVDSEEPSRVLSVTREASFLFTAVPGVWKKHKWLWFVLACSLAMSEETRACLLQVCNYCFCLLLRTAPSDLPQTWKSPNCRKKQEPRTWNISGGL